MTYRVLPAADADLDDQAAYLAREASIETAFRFYDAAARPRTNIRVTSRHLDRLSGDGVVISSPKRP